MTAYVKEGGAWKPIDFGMQKVSGNWDNLNGLFLKQSGAWERIQIGNFIDVWPVTGFTAVDFRSGGPTTDFTLNPLPPLERAHRKIVVAVSNINTVTGFKIGPYIEQVRLDDVTIPLVPNSRAVEPSTSLGDRQETAIFAYDDDAESFTGDLRVRVSYRAANNTSKGSRFYLYIIDSDRPFGSPVAAAEWTNSNNQFLTASLSPTGRHFYVAVGATYDRDSILNMVGIDNVDWHTSQTTFYHTSGHELKDGGIDVDVWSEPGSGGSRGAAVSVVGWPV